jgi:hypothetical protein
VGNGEFLAYFEKKQNIHNRAINYVDPTKHGFRVILRDEFLREHMAPTLLPTLYVTAIPLKSGQLPVTKVLYPDSVNEDRQVMNELMENRNKTENEQILL